MTADRQGVLPPPEPAAPWAIRVGTGDLESPDQFAVRAALDRGSRKGASSRDKLPVLPVEEVLADNHEKTLSDAIYVLPLLLIGHGFRAVGVIGTYARILLGYEEEIRRSKRQSRSASRRR